MRLSIRNTRSVMAFSKKLFGMLIVLVGLAYTVESTFPSVAMSDIEKTKEEREFKEEIESLVPVRIDSRKPIIHSTRISTLVSPLEFLPVASRKPIYTYSRIILHRALLI